MKLEHVTSFLDRRAAGAARSWGSLARIMVVAAISFLSLGSLFPDYHRTFDENQYNRVGGVAADTVTRINSGRRSDIHGFQPREDPNTFRIAWVGGSSIQSISDSYYTFIPAEVSRNVSTIDGKPVQTDVYFLSGIRALDSYVAALAAVDDEPDLIVITINPAWVFNNSATRGWPELDAQAAQLLLDDPQSAALLGPYLAPSDLLLGAAAYASAPVRDRIRLSPDIAETFTKFSLLDRTTPNEPGELSELDEIRGFNIPLNFWTRYRNDSVAGLSIAERQALFLLQSDLENETVNTAVLQAMGRITRESGIPTYAYVAPVNHESLEDPMVNQAVLDIEARVADYRDDWAGPNQRLVPQNLSRSVAPFAFEDLIHIQEPDAVSVFLADELCVFLAETGSDCS